MTEIESVQARIVCKIDEETCRASPNLNGHREIAIDSRTHNRTCANFAGQFAEAGMSCRFYGQLLSMLRNDRAFLLLVHATLPTWDCGICCGQKVYRNQIDEHQQYDERSERQEFSRTSILLIRHHDHRSLPTR